MRWRRPQPVEPLDSDMTSALDWLARIEAKLDEILELLEEEGDDGRDEMDA
jgi:hypothetical protein